MSRRMMQHYLDDFEDFDGSSSSHKFFDEEWPAWPSWSMTPTSMPTHSKRFREHRVVSHNTTPLALGAFDHQETDNEHLFLFDAPGVRSEDLRVEIRDGRTVSVSGSRHTEEDVEDRDHHTHHIECVTGSFKRSFDLPEDADPEQISADFSAGVLNLHIGKREASKSIPIQYTRS
eukprot:m.288998 g.288998  ORF g.288998 m.288998 type:complete len:175 (+) comp12058_c0_seq1:62-586(+)